MTRQEKKGKVDMKRQKKPFENKTNLIVTVR